LQKGNTTVNVIQTSPTEKPGTPIRGKKFWMVTGIIIGAIIILILGYTIFPVPGNTESPVTPAATNSPPRLHVTTISPPEGSPAIRRPDTYVAETSRIPVDFVLQSGETTSCGLTCRQLDATIANTGFDTAHNVCITVALHNSRNEVINLNGEAFIKRCIGDLAGGETRTEPISVNADCGVFATKCIGETLTLQTQVSSDEKTAQFPDQVIKV
jgi:hypothetical protein